MSYSVKPGNIFGRIGQNFAEGLGTTAPKEMERLRLADALQQIGNTPNQSLFQQFAALASAPGSTPQMQQTGAELLKQQGIRDAYKRTSGRQVDPTSGQAMPPEAAGMPQQDMRRDYTGQQQGQLNPQTIQQQQQQIIPPGYASRAAEAAANPPAASDNPLNPKYMPKGAWTQQQQERAVNEGFDRGIATNMADALAYAKQQENYWNTASEAERAKYEYKRGIDQQVDDLFDKQMETRLQKTGPDTYQDVSGDLQLDLKKQAKNAVATGKMTPQEAVEYYSKAALDLGKQKSQFHNLANPSFDEYLIPSKKNERIQRLMTMGNEFAKYGPAAQEEFYKMLINKNTGMGISPGGAAILAYPRSSEVKNLINDAKLRGGDLQYRTQQAVRVADDVLNKMKPNDSLLAIVRELYSKYPSFDERSFFDYLRDNKDRWPNNPNFVREMEAGVSDVLPNWYDLFLFPSYGLSPAHK